MVWRRKTLVPGRDVKERVTAWTSRHRTIRDGKGSLSMKKVRSSSLERGRRSFLIKRVKETPVLPSKIRLEGENFQFPNAQGKKKILWSQGLSGGGRECRSRGADSGGLASFRPSAKRTRKTQSEIRARQGLGWLSPEESPPPKERAHPSRRRVPTSQTSASDGGEGGGSLNLALNQRSTEKTD